MDDLIEFAVEMGLELLEPLWCAIEKLFCKLTGREPKPRPRQTPKRACDEDAAEEQKRFRTRFVLCTLGLLLIVLTAALLIL